MEPHEERVIIERDDLAERLIKLRAFIGTEGRKPNPIYTALPEDEQARLRAQEFHMTMYWKVLCARVNNFRTSKR